MELPGLVVAVWLLLYVSTTSHATKGIDLSTSTPKTAFSCLKDQGYDFVVVRAYHSTGSPDSTATSTLASAHAAGISNTDVYLFPCPKCSKSATQQVTEMGEFTAAKWVHWGHAGQLATSHAHGAMSACY